MASFDIPAYTLASVVVPVHNRAGQLARLLDSLGQLTFPKSDFCVVVCDDGSTEDLRPVLQDAGKRHGLVVYHLKQEQRGPGAARNLGLQFVNSMYTAFTDSDCEVDAGWLTGLIAKFDDPAVGVVGGSVRPHPQAPLVTQCSNWIMSTPWGGGARDPRSFAAMDYYPRASNIGVRSRLAVECGGFPTTRYGEDVGFSHRVVNAGTKSAFVEEAVVYHNEKRTLAQIFAEAFRKGRARIQLWRSQGAIEVIHVVPALFVMYLIAILVCALAWPRLLIYAGVPALVYGILLLPLIGIQSARRLRRVAAFLLAPCCAMLMHIGYGLGLLIPKFSGTTSPIETSFRDEKGTASSSRNRLNCSNPADVRNGVLHQ